MKSRLPLLLPAVLGLCACDGASGPAASVERRAAGAQPSAGQAPGGRPQAPQASAEPAASAWVAPAIASGTPAAAEAAPDAGPATVERVAVAGDQPAAIVRGAAGTTFHLLFLPGLCSNAYAYLLSFPEVARAHGGVVAIDGDRACGAESSGFRSFTWNAKLQRGRFEAAIAAAGLRAPAEGYTLVGYSSGASIGELMHAEWPELFARLVLIAPPKDPSLARLRQARGVVCMSCSRDVPVRMKKATARLRGAGVPSLYLEMPGCAHGNIADGELLFGRAFDWLESLATPGEAPSLWPDAG